MSSPKTLQRKPARPMKATHVPMPHDAILRDAMLQDAILQNATPIAARAAVVNRTHRVVREQALDMKQQKQRSRGLWVPLGICSMMLLVVCYAAWGMLDGYDLAPTGVPDAGDQLFLLLLWLLPVTAVILGLVWLKRVRGRFNNSEAAQ